MSVDPQHPDYVAESWLKALQSPDLHPLLSNQGLLRTHKHVYIDPTLKEPMLQHIQELKIACVNLLSTARAHATSVAPTQTQPHTNNLSMREIRVRLICPSRPQQHTNSQPNVLTALIPEGALGMRSTMVLPARPHTHPHPQPRTLPLLPEELKPPGKKAKPPEKSPEDMEIRHTVDFWSWVNALNIFGPVAKRADLAPLKPIGEDLNAYAIPAPKVLDNARELPCICSSTDCKCSSVHNPISASIDIHSQVNGLDGSQDQSVFMERLLSSFVNPPHALITNGKRKHEQVRAVPQMSPQQQRTESMNGANGKRSRSEIVHSQTNTHTYTHPHTLSLPPSSASHLMCDVSHTSLKSRVYMELAANDLIADAQTHTHRCSNSKIETDSQSDTLKESYSDAIGTRTCTCMPHLYSSYEDLERYKSEFGLDSDVGLELRRKQEELANIEVLSNTLLVKARKNALAEIEQSNEVRRTREWEKRVIAQYTKHRQKETKASPSKPQPKFADMPW